MGSSVLVPEYGRMIASNWIQKWQDFGTKVLSMDAMDMGQYLSVKILLSVIIGVLTCLFLHFLQVSGDVILICEGRGFEFVMMDI